MSSDGAMVFATDLLNHRFQIFDSSGTFLGARGTRGSEDGQLDRPRSIAVSPFGTIYVADGNNNRISVWGIDPPAIPSISRISPFSATAGQTISVTVDGVNFQSGATLKLSFAGQNDILASNVAVIGTTKITGTISIASATTGENWSVVVTNPDFKSGAFPNAFTIIIDTTPPAQALDLVAENKISTSMASAKVTLEWTAPGDDAAIGNIIDGQLDLRYSSSTSDYNFMEAQVLRSTAMAAGSGQGLIIAGLQRGTTYFFALRTADEVPNFNIPSNIVSPRTLEAISEGNLAITTTTLLIEAAQAFQITVTTLSIADLSATAQVQLQDSVAIGPVYDLGPDG
ncbi:MAG: hypothetical protein HY747_03580, partial [Elusimicrobia bacterium]|nr:hypothetical protein [Elusimicrobiota bacterium]